MIESYTFGKIVIDGNTCNSDVIIFPDRVDASWWRKEGHKLHIEDITEIIQEKPEVLVVGTGNAGFMRVLPETKRYIESKGLELVIEKTEEACKIFNELSKSKRVIAALHLTC